MPSHGRPLSVCQITTRDLTLEQDVELYVRAGIAGISFWTDKLAACGIARAASLLRDSGLVPVSLMNTPHFVTPADQSPAQAREELLRWMDICAELGVPIMGCVPGNSDGRPAAELARETVEVLQHLAPEARARGVTLVLEPIRFPYFTFLNTLEEADRIVRAVDDPQVKILFDCWHLCHEPDLLAKIARTASRIGLVHFSDYRVPTRQHDDRMIPGEGVMALAEILHALDASGYAGFYDVEIFSDEVWAADPVVTMGKIRRYFEGLWPA